MLYSVKISIRELSELVKYPEFCGLIAAGVILVKHTGFSDYIFVQPANLEYAAGVLSKIGLPVADYLASALRIILENQVSNKG